MCPSPHCSTQWSFLVWSPPDQCQPEISPDQSFNHPMPSVLSPSSQPSPATLRPSPQMLLQTDIEWTVWPDQSHPFPTRQVFVHALVSSLSASSHSSPNSGSYIPK